jgi:hypothetical protein
MPPRAGARASLGSPSRSTDAAYRWIVGDREVGHQALSKCRVEHGAALDELMTDILARCSTGAR